MSPRHAERPEAERPTAARANAAPPLPAAFAEYLSHPSLAPLWATVRDRLERRQLTVAGVVVVPLDEEGADRLAGLLGARVIAGRSRVRLAALDSALRASAAQAGLVSVVESLSGLLVNRTARRADDAAAWSRVWAALDAGLEEAGLAAAPWARPFVDGVRRSGLLTRAGVEAAGEAVGQAGAVLRVLADAGCLGGSAAEVSSTLSSTPRWELAELASRCTGDAHALDDGRVAAALVLRAGAAHHRLPAPVSAADRRKVWGRLAVMPDLISGTVIVWGLAPAGDGRWEQMMRARADLGLITHLTVHELRTLPEALPLAGPGRPVWVCENPQLLQAIARARTAVPTQPLLCLSGNPSSAGWLLVRRLVLAGADVRYHGDFDWAGVEIAGRVIAAGGRPWRMGAADYHAAVDAQPAVGRLALSGRPACTPWDPELAVAMSERQTAVHEESLLGTLLDDLGDFGDNP